jgi:hypothetical protein
MDGFTHNQYIICSGTTLADKLDAWIVLTRVREGQAGRQVGRPETKQRTDQTRPDYTRRGGVMEDFPGRMGILARSGTALSVSVSVCLSFTQLCCAGHTLFRGLAPPSLHWFLLSSTPGGCGVSHNSPVSAGLQPTHSTLTPPGCSDDLPCIALVAPSSHAKEIGGHCGTAVLTF